MERVRHKASMILAGLLITALVFAHFYRTLVCISTVKVEVGYQAYKKELLTVYWDSGDGWNARDFRSVKVDPRHSRYQFLIPGSENFLKIRIDPDSRFDSALVKKIIITGLENAVMISGQGDFNANGIVTAQKAGGTMFYREKNNEDPFVTIIIPAESQKIAADILWTDYVWLFLVVVAGGLLTWLLVRSGFLASCLYRLSFPDSILLVLFLLLMILPYLNRVLPFYSQGLNEENRTLAEAPGMSVLLQKPDSFFVSSEKWLNDHFDFRNIMVRSNSLFRFYTFGVSPLRNKVIVGKEQQFFPVNELLQDDWFGRRKFSDYELLIMKQNLLLKINYFNEKGIPFLLVIPPSKQTFCQDYLPETFRSFRTGKTMLEQFTDYLGPDLDNYILVLYDSMKLHQRESRDKEWYYQYDMHWNELAAFDAYQTVMNKVYRLIPEAGSPLDRSTVSVTEEWDDQADLAKNLLLNKLLLRKKYSIIPLENRPLTLNPLYGEFRFPALEYLNPAGKKTALFFRDSFSDQWKELFAYHFAKTTYIWDQHITDQIIMKYKPDIVIQEVCEMFLQDLFIPLNDTIQKQKLSL